MHFERLRRTGCRVAPGFSEEKVIVFFLAGAKSVRLFEANERKTMGRSVEVDVDRKLLDGTGRDVGHLIAVLVEKL